MSRAWYSEVSWWSLLFLGAVPLVWFEHVPTLDGPAHRYTVQTILALLQGDGGVLARVFALDLRPWPNWAVQGVIGTMGPWIGWAGAERSVLVLAYFSLPLAFRYVLVRVGVRSAWPAFLVFPLVHHHLLYLGFWNYTLGVALALAMTGSLVGCGIPSWRRVVVLGLMGLLLYFCHPLAWGLGMLWAWVVWGWTAAGEARSPQARLQAGTRLACAFFPSALMMFWFWNQRPDAAWGGHVPWRDLLGYLLRVDVASPFSREFSPGIVFFAVLALALGALGVWKNPREAKSRVSIALLACAVLSLVLCVVLPDEGAGGSLIQYRLTVLPWLFYLLWLGRGLVSTPFGTWLIVGSALVSTGILGLTLVSALASFQQPATGFVRLLSVIESESVLLVMTPSSFREAAPWRFSPWEHAAAAASLPDRHVAWINHYQARAHGFPLKFRPGINPHTALGFPELTPDRLNFERYAQVSGIRPDYILAFGESRKFVPAGFDLIAGDGRISAELWVRRSR
jgi:hypothetical protein